MPFDDDDLAKWRRQFDSAPFLADPFLLNRPLTVLVDVADRLAGAKEILRSVAAGTADEREFGRRVGIIALDFAARVLEHIGALDDADAPPPINLEAAQTAVENLLSFVQRQIELGNEALRPVSDAEAGTAELAGKLEINRGTFTVTYRSRPCELGNTKAFSLLERLNKSAGRFVSVDNLIQDVWQGEAVSDEAVQKQASILRSKLNAAGLAGVVIDGNERGHYRLKLE